MTARLRLLCPALAVVAVGLTGRVVAQSNSASSPFLPPAAAMVSTAPSETLEFAGVNAMAKQTYISIFDRATKKSRWIPVGGSEGGLSVLAYDPRRDQVVIKTGEVQKTLTLRKSTGTLNAPSPVAAMPAAAGFAVANPAGHPSGLTLQPPVAVAGTAVTGPVDPTQVALPVEANATKQDGPAKPLTVARQEEEARMLVSDLLEIGMAQRKAYEEAQKKASAPATDQPAPATPNPPPGG